MLGVDLSFAAFSIIEGMAAHKYSLKRPAYAAASIAFAGGGVAPPALEDAISNGKSKQQQQKQQQQWPLAELSLLTINLFKKDLSSSQMFETGLALQTLCCVSLSKEMVGALLPDVLMLLSSSRPYIRKKAALCCSCFLLQQLRELQQMQQRKMQQRLRLPYAGTAAAEEEGDTAVLQQVVQRMQQQLMQEQDVGVLCCLATSLLQAAAVDPHPFLPLVPPLFHLLCSSNSNWFSIKLLQLFLLLSAVEPRLPQKLLRPLATLLQQTKAKSVEVEAIRLALFYAPIETAATAAAASASQVATAEQAAAAAMTKDATTANANVRTASDSGGGLEQQLLQLVCRKLHALVTSPDPNVRFVALDVLKQTFLRRRQLVQPLLQLLPDLQQHMLQSAKSLDPTVRRVGVSLLATAASPATFPVVCERLLAAAFEAGSSSSGRKSSPSSGSSATGNSAASFVSSADFILPVVQMAYESAYELVEDFEWYVAVLADVACNGSSSSSSSSSDAPLAAAVAQQLVDISVRVPEVRPCSTHLCMLLLEAAAAAAAKPKVRGSASSSNSLHLLRALRQQHREAHISSSALGEDDPGAFRNNNSTSGPSSSGTAAASPSQVYIHPDIVRAAGWIIGEYHQQLAKGADYATTGIRFIEDAVSCLLTLVLLWAATKAFLTLTAVSRGALRLQQEQGLQQHAEDSAAEREAAAAAVQRLKPKIQQATQHARSSTDAELQVPAELDLENPFLDAAALQQQLDLRLRRQQQQQQQQQMAASAGADALPQNSSSSFLSSSSILLPQQHKQQRQPLEQQQASPWAVSGKKKFSVIKGAIAPGMHVKDHAALSPTAPLPPTPPPLYAGHAARQQRTSPQAAANAAAETPCAVEKRDQQASQQPQQLWWSVSGGDSAVQLLTSDWHLKHVEAERGCLCVSVCCSPQSLPISAIDHVYLRIKACSEAAPAASFCLSDVSATLCEKLSEQRSNAVKLEVPVSISALWHAAREAPAALALRGVLHYSLAAGSALLQPFDSQQQQQIEQCEVPVMLRVPFSVLLRPLQHTPESLGILMAVRICVPTPDTTGRGIRASKRFLELLGQAANMHLVEVQESNTTAATEWTLKALFVAAVRSDVQQQHQDIVYVALVSLSAAAAREGALQISVAVKGEAQDTVTLAETLKQHLEVITSAAARGLYTFSQSICASEDVDCSRQPFTPHPPPEAACLFQRAKSKIEDVKHGNSRSETAGTVEASACRGVKKLDGQRTRFARTRTPKQIKEILLGGGV
ncbi:uncharacterized protein LOC34617453 [Cyclospora cayetanensis]|uniref:Uncharacterized protein LOC34617453 n=1 Tax=Cyclospora cayetanensis TaxID=88456 RepID=A0A6P6S2X2_9EIME|nr:uncharacterized protein LOC34617453 [Cyclospora cayetanensis]